MLVHGLLDHKLINQSGPAAMEARLWFARTRVSDILKILEDGFYFRPFLWFLVPAPLSNHPDPGGDPWGTKVTRPLWSSSSLDHLLDVGFHGIREWHLSSHELETKTIGGQGIILQEIDVPRR